MSTPELANTMTRMTKTGVIKRTDKGMFISLDQIYIDPKFNKRFETPRLERSIRELADFLIDRKAKAQGEKKLIDLTEYLPQLEVYARQEGGVTIVEGHRRTRALRLLQAEGYPIPMVPIKPFTGDAKARTTRIATSASQLELEPLEQAAIYMEMESVHGMNQEEIALDVNKSRQHVEQMLLIGKATPEVRQQILDGLIAPGTAVGIVRQHREGAAEVIQAEHAKAVAMGKSKVTSGTIKKAAGAQKPKVPGALAVDMAVAADRLAREVPQDAQALVERYRAGESALGDQTVPITIRSLNALLISAAHVAEAQAEQARRAAEKQAQEGQE